ncbi:MAG: hypothetical protein HY443_00880 [Candidatus Nealsonbacteria bacterium]|nr:hypothetical protein [Candidatus Nealsonbacteria bacterium]
MHFFEFHLTNPFNFWGPSIAQNVYILALISLTTIVFILAAWFILLYLKTFYGERAVPREWMVFWWAFVFFALHEIFEVLSLYQWIHGLFFVFLYFAIEIAAVVLLTWGCYLLVKTYVLKR